ncbi:hypothetical protein [Nocardia colli]|uniref:hypothetical protein n=1 Tax=Nocardia colli TaxID=2545717 RepID=UPI0035D7421C
MNTDPTSPHPEEPDLHLHLTLHGITLDYAACRTSALFFLEEQRRRHFIDSVCVIPGETTGLPRLPGERLFDGP